ncbi:hypothetical protein [Sphingobium indicum]|uniref:hypothetical protein n=1 Tax=Sphingobium indicum TaxID=332055 RepID=UPI000559FBD6|nr:hypothetical protein [Sphingobium indicum]
MTTQPTPKDALPETLWLEAEELLEAPFLLATEWWLTAAESLARPSKPHEHRNDHHQLPVPEPLDITSEPGLFA